VNQSCKDCGGACCRYISLPVMTPDRNWMLADPAWMEARGEIVGDKWIIKSTCPHLTADGLCDIHETKPETCRKYEVDGESCKRIRQHQHGEEM